MNDLSQRPVTLDRIIAAVVRHSGVGIPELCGPYRHTEIVRARRAFVVVARWHTRASFPEISRVYRPCGSHTTALTGYYAALELLDSTAERDAEPRKLLAGLSDAVRADMTRVGEVAA